MVAPREALVCSLAFVLCVVPLASATIPGVHTHGISFRDDANKTRLFHGTNYVEKGQPYLPKINADEIAKLTLIGANVVRLGVMLPGVLPTSATPNMTYLETIGTMVDLLWSHGIASVLDLHQDVISDKFCGEGAPDWMVNVSELGALPFPLPLSFANESVADAKSGDYIPSPDCQARGPLKFIGWSEFYMTDACGKTFQHLFEGRSTLGKMIEQHWATVASFFKGRAGVLAYELLNEPWVGDHVGHPSLLLEKGKAEKGALGDFMTRMHQTVRSVDPDTMTLYAPAEINNRLQRHVGYDKGFLSGEPMAFHVYCLTGTDGPGPTTPFTKELCHFNDHFQLSTRRSDLQRLDTPGFVTEFGAVSDVATGLAEVRFVTEHLDGPGMPLSWMFWAGVPDQRDYRQELARSYATAIAGDVHAMSFNATDATFELSFAPLGDETATTEVFLSRELHYPNGWKVDVSPPDCCNVTDTANGIQLTAKGPQVTVHVSPK